MLRKSAQIRSLETAYGQDIAQIVLDAYLAHGTIGRAAEALGVSPNTFGFWKGRLLEQRFAVRPRQTVTAAAAAVLPAA